MKRLTFLFVILLLLAGCRTNDKYYGIDHFYMTEEGDAFNKAYSELTVDIYDWYGSIEGQDGVYIIHYEYYPKEMLKEWQESGYMETVPENDLHYYVASINYLKDRGMSFTAAEEEAINSGTRFYLLPDTLSEEETETMKRYLTEDALFGLSEDAMIATAFNRDPVIEFRTYHPDVTLEVPGQEDISGPVIYVASCQNMKYFESESLIATGVNDGYIRLTYEAYQKYAGKDLPQKLKDRKVTFLGISRMSN